MATVLGSLLISLGLDSGEFRSGMTQAERELVQSQKRIEKVGAAMQDVGQRLTLGLTVPLVAFGGFAVKAASDAAELQSAFDQTFGAMSASMTKWAEDTGDAMGRSTQEIQQAANTFGIFFNQAAPTRQAAAELSQQFAVLAQDLSSFFNVDPTVALEKLRSGLSGESEPLRDFGVFLNEASVEAKAFELGIASAGAELTEQQKIMARAALIMQATTNAQGDVARTADGTANRIRAARAAFEELQVAIGEKLIPALTPLIAGLSGVLNALAGLPDGVQTGIVVFGGLLAVAGPLIFAIGSLKIGLTTLAGAFAAASGSVLTLSAATKGLALAFGPLGITLSAIVAAMLLLWNRAERAEDNLRSFTSAANEAESRVAELESRFLDAGGALKGLGNKAGEAKVKVDGLTQSMIGAVKSASNLISILQTLGIEEARQRRLEIAREKRRIGDDLRSRKYSPVAYTPGGNAAAGLVSADARSQTEKNSLAALDREDAALIREIEIRVSAARQGISLSPESGAGTASGVGEKPKGSGPSSSAGGASASQIEARFNSELASYAQQALGAMASLAKTADERAEIELRGVELARQRTLSEIAADADYSKTQKARLANQVEALAELERAAIEQARMREVEQQQIDLAGQAFSVERDLLQADLQLANTATQRQTIARDILSLEQEYRRNQLDRVLASDVATDADKRIAQALIDQLAAIEGAERAVSNRQNETPVERYRRELNMSVDQVNEAMDGIRIQGLESLNQGLVDAITGVKSLGDVFKNVANQIIADLLRIAIRKAIIAPLANALFGGGGGGSGGIGNILGGLKGFGSSVAGAIKIDGARAMGGPVLAGGTYLVGERGPELFRPTRSGAIVSNRDLRQAHGLAGGVHVTVGVDPRTGNLTAFVDGRVQQQAPAIAGAGADLATSSMARSRKWSLSG